MDSATKETCEVLQFRVIHITNGSTINAFVGYCTIQRRDRQTDRQTDSATVQSDVVACGIRCETDAQFTSPDATRRD